MTQDDSISTTYVATLPALADGSPPALFVEDEPAAKRFWDFFTANIRSPHTRRAYYNAIGKFSEFCALRGANNLSLVRPLHVAPYVESLRESFAKPMVKQHLAAIRMLFDWLVFGQIIDTNPAHAVRGPRHVVKKGRTPILTNEEARSLLAAADVTTPTGLRDRALIAVMIYTFARIGAVLQMNVRDYFTQGRPGRIRLHEKRGREHEAPCVSKLETYLDAYIALPASRTSRTARYGGLRAALRAPSPARRSRTATG